MRAQDDGAGQPALRGRGATGSATGSRSCSSTCRATSRTRCGACATSPRRWAKRKDGGEPEGADVLLRADRLRAAHGAAQWCRGSSPARARSTSSCRTSPGRASRSRCSAASSRRPTRRADRRQPLGLDRADDDQGRGVLRRLRGSRDAAGRRQARRASRRRVRRAPRRRWRNRLSHRLGAVKELAAGLFQLKGFPPRGSTSI